MHKRAYIAAVIVRSYEIVDLLRFDLRTRLYKSEEFLGGFQFLLNGLVPATKSLPSTFAFFGLEMAFGTQRLTSRASRSRADRQSNRASTGL
jgi:hypothetical protein